MVLHERCTPIKLFILAVLSAFLFACSDADDADETAEVAVKKKGMTLTSPATSGGVILACAKKQNGQLRIVDDHSECHPSEDPVS